MIDNSGGIWVGGGGRVVALRGVVSGGRVDTGITVGMVYAVCGGGDGGGGCGCFFHCFRSCRHPATVVAAGVCVGRGIGPIPCKAY